MMMMMMMMMMMSDNLMITNSCMYAALYGIH